MKLWQKTYLLTLILFLVCLNAGILALTYDTYGERIKAEEDVCRAEQTALVRSLARDLDTLLSAGGGTSVGLLMDSYGKQYADQGIELLFYKDGETVHTSFSGEVLYQTDALAHRMRGGKRYILIDGAVGDSGYRLVFGKDVSVLDETFSRLMTVFILTAAGVSALLALCLFFVLRRLSVPLERLRRASDSIASGDLSVTAEEKGGDEVAALAKSFNTMVGKLRAQMQTLERDAKQKQMLVDNMAHELRTPLTGIKGYAEFIEKAAADEEVKLEAAHCIVTEASRLQSISEKLLDTAFLREGLIEKNEVDLAALLADTASRFEPRARGKGVALCLQTVPTVVSADATLLSVLFDNLTENAIKSGASEVVLICKDGAVQVCDNGKGMTAEQLSHITEPFYRTDRSRSRAEGGAGLGLALCKQIVSAHGARMEFASGVGKGTAVEVRFERSEGSAL